IRTCRTLGISPVAAFSRIDEKAPHVRDADLTVLVESYLDGPALVAAARAAGADAVHPGYGFLSENAGFAQAVQAAGLTWIGPPPEAIEAMGSKIAAKKLMADAGVPVLPELDPSAVDTFPVLVKASAGGGGRGMRIVRSAAELAGAVESARREAEAAFGDPAVFCEPYVEAGRHVEVQILADTHGTVWTLGERDCSIQRRHQKIVEECPAPGLVPAARRALWSAAERAARAIGYTGAGTVEFLLDPSGDFHFLEVNTRLQVEHPVTECVYGLDLVALQIRIAEGLALDAEPPEPRGHAIEARLYAEDPAAGWLPQAGTLHHFAVPGVDAEFAVPPHYGLRLDSGVEAGSVIGTQYDPMLAKLIAWAPTREEAARRLATALAGSRIHGVGTNRDLLVRALRDPSFLAGDVSTAFVSRPGLMDPLLDPADRPVAALAAALAGAVRRRASAHVQRGVPLGWRNNPSQLSSAVFSAPDGERIEVGYGLTRSGYSTSLGLAVSSARADLVELVRDGVVVPFSVAVVDEVSFVDSPWGSVALAEEPVFADPAEAVDPGSLRAPMPGTVIRVLAAEGSQVEAGDPLLILEAMKMEHPVLAPHAGLVASLHVTEGQQVEAGSVVAIIAAVIADPED
ncbi:MAG: acetyl/propionyl-CoA carboxylase subuit alpha, partial [Actinomycetia bacterium]|nr:acetyl/propionyl-CoA carboxylase subuit alpha [Actinomycetes bacterium]